MIDLLSRPSFRLVTALATLCIAAHASAAVVFSDDFSADLATGSVGTATQYTLLAPGAYTLPPGYRVISNPAPPTFINGYASFFDHTQGTANGAMMFFDGAGDQRDIYSFSRTLTAGSQYTFSFWGAATSTNPVAQLVGTVNGVAVGAVLTTTLDQWTQFTYTFVAGAGSTTFAIYDQVTDAGNNDGAIDDVSLVGPDAPPPPRNGVPEPEVVGLLAAGLLGAGVARRRTRNGVKRA